jgi:hypothetical protein
VDEADPFAVATAQADPSATSSVAPSTQPNAGEDAMAGGAVAGGDAMAPGNEAAPVQRTGMFVSLDHPTTGSVRVGTAPDGRQVVFIENLSTDNGPDLKVYLSPSASVGVRSLGDGAISLGALKGNKGNQTYEVPAGTDLSAFNSVAIWCERFSVGFGTASLSA